MTKIKNLLFLFMVVSLPLVFTACSDDDNDGVNNSIVGTWKFNSAVAGEVKTNSTVNDTKVKSYVVAQAKDDFEEFTYTFKENGSVTITSSTDPDVDNGTYTLKDGVLTLSWGEGDYDVYTASVVNGVFIMTEDYTEDLNDMELDELIAIGITDVNFQATKATAKINYTRQ